MPPLTLVITLAHLHTPSIHQVIGVLPKETLISSDYSALGKVLDAI